MDTNILIAEDDTVLQKLLCDMIKKQGYVPIKANNGKEALDLFFENNISLCILDVMMPVYNGFEVLESIREYSKVPVLMLTALGDEQNELKGLKNGANDYISKPFSYPVFVARIENLLKTAKEGIEEKLTIGEISLSQDTHEILMLDEKVELNNKEYFLLEYFMLNKEVILTREQILIKVWGFDYDGDIRTVDTHIKMLRKKMGEYGEYIQTVRGSGYKFKTN